MAKKRYAGLKYEPDGKGAMVLKGIDCKGIETEKKDALPFVKEIMHGCLDLLMHRQDEHAALRLFEAKAADLVAGRIPFDKFVFRKNFHSKVEAKTDTIAHARVNELRKARAPGSEAAPNWISGPAMIRCQRAMTTAWSWSPMISRRVRPRRSPRHAALTCSPAIRQTKSPNSGS